MKGPDFLDSNILVYAYDKSAPSKQQIARELLRNASEVDAAISTQVLGEFAVAMLHKVSPAVSGAALIRVLDALSPIRTIFPDDNTVRRAVEAHAKYGVHLHDGMILASAEKAGCSQILSEDLNNGQEYFGIRVTNPFT